MKEHDNSEIDKLMGKCVAEMVNTEIKKPIKGAGFGILIPEEK